jgi:zinc protease
VKRPAIILLALLLAACTASTPADKGLPPEPRPLGRVDFPSYEKRVLANGLTVYAMEFHEQPIVAIRLMIKAGAERDPANLAGVAAFTADLLNKGTQKRSATEIAETIDQVGGTLEASSDMESTNITAGVLTDSLNVAFDLMNDIVMNPAFAPQELARAQQQATSNLFANLQDANFLADASFNRIVYGSHPYGHLETGTPASIPKIRRDDLVKFHDTYYAPNISALAIVGDLSTADAFKLAEQWFGSWAKKDVAAAENPPPPQLEGRRIVAIDKPDAVQTEIRVGHTTVGRKDSDYFNVLVASYILGGSGSGLLYQSLRVERGLTYGAYTTIVPRRGPGLFESTTNTRTPKTAETLNLIFDQLQKFRSAEVPAEELQNAKSYLIGTFPLSIEVPNSLANRLTTVFLYDLGDDYLKTFRDRLADVSAADVLRVAREKISAENTAVVLVGKADDFKSQLEPLGKLDIIPLEKLDLDSPTLRKGN